MPLESIACAGGEQEIHEEDGDENEGSDDDVEGFEAEDALFFFAVKIGGWDVVFAVVVSVIEFGHGYTIFLGRAM